MLVGRSRRFFLQIVQGRLTARPAELFVRKITSRRIQISPQRTVCGIEIARLSPHVQKAIVRDILSQVSSAQKPVGKTKNRNPVALIQFDESRLVTSPCLYQQKFVCDSLWQSSTRSCRNPLPAL